MQIDLQSSSHSSNIASNIPYYDLEPVVHHRNYDIHGPAAKRRNEIKASPLYLDSPQQDPDRLATAQYLTKITT